MSFNTHILSALIILSVTCTNILRLQHLSACRLTSPALEGGDQGLKICCVASQHEAESSWLNHIFHPHSCCRGPVLLDLQPELKASSLWVEAKTSCLLQLGFLGGVCGASQAVHLWHRCVLAETEAKKENNEKSLRVSVGWWLQQGPENQGTLAAVPCVIWSLAVRTPILSPVLLLGEVGQVDECKTF